MNQQDFIRQILETDFYRENDSFAEQGTFHGGGRNEPAYSLFSPMHYESKHAYPLIVWLHGAGSDEGQLRRVMPFISLRNFVAVAPRLVYGETPGRNDPALIEQNEQAIFHAVHLVQTKRKIHAERIFLVGFGQGGTAALRTTLTYPCQWAGVASLGGPFPGCRQPLAQIQAARKIAFYFGQGKKDRDYPTARLCRDLRLLYIAGMDITVRQYPCGRELSDAMLGDLNRWIMEQFATVT